MTAATQCCALNNSRRDDDALIADLARCAVAAKHAAQNFDGSVRLSHEAAEKAYLHAIDLVILHQRINAVAAESEQCTP